MSEELLKMIEEVDPADSTAIEEIEARYICFKMRDVYEGITHDTSTDETPMAKGRNGVYYFDNYATSRDVLKRERPDNVSLTITAFIKMNFCFCTANYWDTKGGTPSDPLPFLSPDLPTEELAEFHAIIQAIAYDRGAA